MDLHELMNQYDLQEASKISSELMPYNDNMSDRELRDALLITNNDKENITPNG